MFASEKKCTNKESLSNTRTFGRDALSSLFDSILSLSNVITPVVLSPGTYQFFHSINKIWKRNFWIFNLRLPVFFPFEADVSVIADLFESLDRVSERNIPPSS